MKKTLLLLMGASMLTFGGRAVAADKADVKSELKDLVAKINGKLQQGKRAEKDLAEDIKQFDALLAEHKGEKTDDVAQVLFMEAMLYAQVFSNPDKAATLVKQLQADFPDTAQGKKAGSMLENLEKQAASKKVQDALAVGSKFPDFTEKDFAGKPVSVSSYKGKVVLVDFWATWCGPCVAELPNVLKTYEKSHPKGFEIIGISLDEKEEALTKFLKERGVTWQQFFDGKGWGNKLAAKYGVMSIPATYLLDREGKILAKDLRGEALEAAVDKALVQP